MLALLSTTGCVYSHKVVNVGSSDVYAVSVKSGKYTFGHGILIAGSGKGYSGSMQIKRKPPPVIAWKNDEHGEILSQEAPIDRTAGTKDEVIFELDGTNVSARIRRLD